MNRATAHLAAPSSAAARASAPGGGATRDGLTRMLQDDLDLFAQALSLEPRSAAEVDRMRGMAETIAANAAALLATFRPAPMVQSRPPLWRSPCGTKAGW